MSTPSRTFIRTSSRPLTRGRDVRRTTRSASRGTGKRAVFCPSHQGGKNWRPAAFNPITRLLYIPANENLCASMEGSKVKYTPGRQFVGAKLKLLSVIAGVKLRHVIAFGTLPCHRRPTESLSPARHGAVTDA